jgi:hypothetical protein
MLVYDREISLGTPAYFVALDFDGDRVVSIHDFLYARYAMDGVDLSPLNPKRYHSKDKDGLVSRRSLSVTPLIQLGPPQISTEIRACSDEPMAKGKPTSR